MTSTFESFLYSELLNEPMRLPVPENPLHEFASIPGHAFATEEVTCCKNLNVRLQTPGKDGVC